MGLSHKFPSFSFELRIKQAQNIESIKSTGNSLFARFYLPEGNNNKIQLNTKKISSKSVKNPFWNESFSLECSCPQEFLEALKHESMVLELRQSKMRIWGSHLVGKGETPWKTILESPNMVFKEWVKMDLSSGNECEENMLKTPDVHVEIKIRVALTGKEEDGCGCKYGHDQHAWLSAEDYDTFALGTALEAF